MWKEIALAAAVLAPAAASQLARTPPVRAIAAAPSAGKTFSATCRDTQLADSRPDPVWVRQSFHHDNCQAPAVPAAINGAKASREQIVAAMAAAKNYAASAAVFRKCVDDFMAARPALTPTDLILENHRILASRKSADRAQAQARAAVEAFNAYGSGCDDL